MNEMRIIFFFAKRLAIESTMYNVAAHRKETFLHFNYTFMLFTNDESCEIKVINFPSSHFFFLFKHLFFLSIYLPTISNIDENVLSKFR